MTTIKPIIDGSTVTEAVRSAYARRDVDAARKICGGIGDAILAQIGSGSLEIRGNSKSGFAVYTLTRRFLVPTRIGGDPVPDDERVEVTGKSERTVERCEMGMLRQMADDWYIDDVTVPGAPYKATS